MKKKIFFFLNIIFSVQLLSQNLSFDIGSPVTEIELTGINKEKIKLSDLRGKLVLIDFWASWCICRSAFSLRMSSRALWGGASTARLPDADASQGASQLG